MTTERYLLKGYLWNGRSFTFKAPLLCEFEAFETTVDAKTVVTALEAVLGSLDREAFA